MPTKPEDPRDAAEWLGEDPAATIAALNARVLALEANEDRLRTALRDMTWAMHADPSCQKGAVAFCVCRACATSRADALALQLRRGNDGNRA